MVNGVWILNGPFIFDGSGRTNSGNNSRADLLRNCIDFVSACIRSVVRMTAKISTWPIYRATTMIINLLASVNATKPTKLNKLESIIYRNGGHKSSESQNKERDSRRFLHLRFSLHANFLPSIRTLALSDYTFSYRVAFSMESPVTPVHIHTGIEYE